MAGEVDMEIFSRLGKVKERENRGCGGNHPEAESVRVGALLSAALGRGCGWRGAIKASSSLKFTDPRR